MVSRTVFNAAVNIKRTAGGWSYARFRDGLGAFFQVVIKVCLMRNSNINVL